MANGLATGEAYLNLNLRPEIWCIQRVGGGQRGKEQRWGDRKEERDERKGERGRTRGEYGGKKVTQTSNTDGKNRNDIKGRRWER